jgi:hypothetical protein
VQCEVHTRVAGTMTWDVSLSLSLCKVLSVFFVHMDGIVASVPLEQPGNGIGGVFDVRLDVLRSERAFPSGTR